MGDSVVVRIDRVVSERLAVVAAYYRKTKVELMNDVLLDYLQKAEIEIFHQGQKSVAPKKAKKKA